MKRRTVLIGAGGIGAATIGGAALSSTVAADGEVETGYFGVSNTHIDSNSGRLEYLNLEDINVIAEWSGFDYPAKHAVFTLEATVGGTTKTIVDSVETEITKEDAGKTDYEGHVMTSVPEEDEPDLVELFGVDAFETPADYDGSDYESDVTKDFDVTFKLTATVTDKDGNEVSGDTTGESMVSVRNLGADVLTGGEGEYNGKEEQDYDKGEPDPEVVWEGAEGITVETHPQQPWVRITNDRPDDVYVVIDWESSGERMYFVESGTNTGWVSASEGEDYESGGVSVASDGHDIEEVPVEISEE